MQFRLCLHQKLVVELFQFLFEVLFVVSLVLPALGGLFYAYIPEMKLVALQAKDGPKH